MNKLYCLLILFGFSHICYGQNGKSEDKNTLFINEKAAVIFQPDSNQVEKRKKEVGEKDFYAGADDYLFYLNNSTKFLDSMKLKIFYAKEKRFVKFLMVDSKSELIKLDTLPELWGVYLFERTKKPKQIDMTAIEEEYKSYYH